MKDTKLMEKKLSINTVKTVGGRLKVESRRFRKKNRLTAQTMIHTYI